MDRKNSQEVRSQDSLCAKDQYIAVSLDARAPDACLLTDVGEHVSSWMPCQGLAVAAGHGERGDLFEGGNGRLRRWGTAVRAPFMSGADVLRTIMTCPSAAQEAT